MPTWIYLMLGIPFMHDATGAQQIPIRQADLHCMVPKDIRYQAFDFLGKVESINLGVPYDYVVKRLLINVAILISVATALVGPIVFLGLLVVNLSYEFMKTFRHQYIILGAVFISIIALIG